MKRGRRVLHCGGVPSSAKVCQAVPAGGRAARRAWEMCSTFFEVDAGWLLRGMTGHSRPKSSHIDMKYEVEAPDTPYIRGLLIPRSRVRIPDGPPRFTCGNQSFGFRFLFLCRWHKRSEGLIALWGLLFLPQRDPVDALADSFDRNISYSIIFVSLLGRALFHTLESLVWRWQADDVWLVEIPVLFGKVRSIVSSAAL